MKTKKFLKLPSLEKEAMKNINGGMQPPPCQVSPPPDIGWPGPPWSIIYPSPLYGISQPGR